METRRAHPRNVPGDWYVEDGCCTLCSVPLDGAPDLFAYAPDADRPDHCFVKRQPESPAELERMVEVTANAELGCIRYRGHAPRVLGALRARGALDRSDHVEAEQIRVGRRTR
jgi:hypothetical protein